MVFFNHLKNIICVLFCLTAFHASAVEIPTGMNRTELAEVTDTLGPNTSAKFLSTPYTLGGFEGFEIGVSTEFISTTDLARLGDQTQKEDTFQYSRLTFGKGLYFNTDLYVHFTPDTSSDNVSEYGGMGKWMFYEGKYLPLSLSFLGYFNTINIRDSFINESMGWDILGGINLSRFSLYFGGGNIKSRTSFSQSLIDCPTPPNCSADITLNANNTFIVRNAYSHSFVGLYVQLKPFFVAAQIDRYVQPVYSGKIGYRF